MSMFSEQVHQVRELLEKHARRTDLYPMAPADEVEIADLEVRVGFTFPDDVRSWFLTVNGCLAGPAGIFGIRPNHPLLDVECRSRGFEAFSRPGLLAISEDGCGNPYVVDLSAATTLHPVYFVEAADPRYVVASGLWPFVRFLLIDDEIEEEGYWPFVRDRVLQEDPELAEYSGNVPFPWDVADLP